MVLVLDLEFLKDTQSLRIKNEFDNSVFIILIPHSRNLKHPLVFVSLV